MRKFFPLLSASALMLLLAACMIPGTFKAKYTLDKDGQYTVSYDGTMINMLPKLAAHEAAQKGQSVSEKTNNEAQALAAEVETDPRTKSFKAVGDDTYKVVMEDGGNIKEQGRAHFPNKDFRFWTLSYNKEDNTVLFVIEDTSPKDLEFLKELGITPSGEISFSTDLPLVSATQELSKSFFGNTHTVKVDETILKEGLTIIWSLE